MELSFGRAKRPSLNEGADMALFGSKRVGSQETPVSKSGLSRAWI